MKDYIPITSDADPAGGLLGTWWRQPPHEIRQATYAPYRGEGLKPVLTKGKVLACAGKRTEWYEPVSEPELLNALLDVAQGQLKPVAFADRFGLLGYNYIVPRENCCKGGDPLDWFMAHAFTVLTVSDLILCLKEARESPGGRQNLANYLKDLSDGPYARGGRVNRIRLRQYLRTNPIPPAIGILRFLLNANFGDAGRGLQSTQHGLRTIFTFRTLIQVVYWQLADQLGRSSIHRCVECGRIFSHSNVRSRFCLPTGGKKISACKSRWNVREFRRKKSARRKKR